MNNKKIFTCKQKREFTLFNSTNYSENYSELKSISNDKLSLSLKISIIYFLDHGKCTNDAPRSVEVSENKIVFIKKDNNIEFVKSLFEEFVNVYPFYSMNQLIFLKELIKESNINSLFANLAIRRNESTNSNLNSYISINRSSKLVGKDLFSIWNVVYKNNQKKRIMKVFKYIYHKIISLLPSNQSINYTTQLKIIILALLYSQPNESLRVPKLYMRFVPGSMALGGTLPSVSLTYCYPELDDFFGNDYDTFSLIKSKPGLINELNHVNKIDKLLATHASHSLGLYSEEMVQYIYNKFNVNLLSNIYFSKNIETNEVRQNNNVRVNHTRKYDHRSDLSNLDPIIRPLFHFFLHHSSTTKILNKVRGLFSLTTNNISQRNITLHYKNNIITFVTFQQKNGTAIKFPYITIHQIASYGIAHISYKQLEMIYNILYQESGSNEEKVALLYDTNMVQYTLLYVLLYFQNRYFKDQLKLFNHQPYNIPQKKLKIEVVKESAVQLAKIGFNYIGLGRPPVINEFRNVRIKDNVFSQILILAHYIALQCDQSIDIQCIFNSYENICNTPNRATQISNYNIMRSYANYINNIINTYLPRIVGEQIQKIQCIDISIFHIPETCIEKIPYRI